MSIVECALYIMLPRRRYERMDGYNIHQHSGNERWVGEGRGANCDSRMNRLLRSPPPDVVVYVMLRIPCKYVYASMRDPDRTERLSRVVGSIAVLRRLRGVSNDKL